MRTVVVGAGPTGLYVGIALARRGHPVTLVDRDTGPADDGSWARRGVMQFHHPHGFRQQVGEALLAEMPDVWRRPARGRGRAGYGVPADRASRSGWPALRCRRLDLRAGAARGRRAAARPHPAQRARGPGRRRARPGGRGPGGRRRPRGRPGRRRLRAGRAARPRAARPGRGRRLRAGLRVPAVPAAPRRRAGPDELPDRHGQLLPRLPDDRLPARQRRLLDARRAARRPTASWPRCATTRPSTRPPRAIPALAAWTDPERARPITSVLPGGRLYNSYQGQTDESGRVALPGLVFVGDAVCTTNPAAGRGVGAVPDAGPRAGPAARRGGRRPGRLRAGLRPVVRRAHRPWFDDHVRTDAGRSAAGPARTSTWTRRCRRT